jgi:hypothetical protein
MREQRLHQEATQLIKKSQTPMMPPPPTPPQIRQKEEVAPKRLKDESPRMNHRVGGDLSSRAGTAAANSLRRGSGNSQSRDALPISRDYNRNMYHENFRSKEIYKSNENF